MKNSVWSRLAVCAAAAGIVVAATIIIWWHRGPAPAEGPQRAIQSPPQSNEERPLVAPVMSAEPTTIDDVPARELTRRFTEEQRRRLEEIGREYGELETRRIEAEREWTLARAHAVNTAMVAPLVAELRTAREALARHMRELPGRTEAEQRVAGAQARATETAARLEALKRHIEEHLSVPEARIHDGCEWCQRDAARMAVREARTDLLRELNQELFTAGAAARTASQAEMAARAELATFLSAARTNEPLRTYYERVQALAKAFHEAMAAVPEVARWREEMEAALAQQQALMSEWHEIHRSAPLVDPVSGEVVDPSQFAAVAAGQPEQMRTTP